MLWFPFVSLLDAEPMLWLGNGWFASPFYPVVSTLECQESIKSWFAVLGFWLYATERGKIAFMQEQVKGFGCGQGAT